MISTIRTTLTVFVLTATILFAGELSNQTVASGKSVVRKAALQPFTLPTFFIGVNKGEQQESILTLQIKNPSIENDQIHFHFIMNSNQERIEGFGTLDPDHRWMTLSNQFTGKIVQDNSGQLMFQPLPSDTLSNWYLKEKN